MSKYENASAELLRFSDISPERTSVLYTEYVSITLCEKYWLNDIYDLGLSAEYKIRRLTLKLSAENVLNLDSNSWINTLVTPYYSAIERYNRMPGCLMAGLKWTY